MSRTTIIYMLVLLASVTGVTLVIERGMRLKAPPDLSGQWEIHSDEGAGLGRHLLVEQSGRFVRLNFDGGLSVDLELASGAEMDFQSESWKFTAIRHSQNGPLTCQLIGPQRHTFTLTRPGGGATAAAVQWLPLAPMTQTADVDAP